LQAIKSGQSDIGISHSIQDGHYQELIGVCSDLGSFNSYEIFSQWNEAGSDATCGAAKERMAIGGTFKHMDSSCERG
jgi:hypothetical protein